MEYIDLIASGDIHSGYSSDREEFESLIPSYRKALRQRSVLVRLVHVLKTMEFPPNGTSRRITLCEKRINKLTNQIDSVRSEPLFPEYF